MIDPGIHLLIEEYKEYPIVLAISVATYLGIKYRSSLKRFINKKILKSVFNNKKEHLDIVESLRKVEHTLILLIDSIDTLNIRVAGVEKSNAIISEDQKKLNHRYTVSIANETVMQTKLLEVINSINYNTSFPNNTEFKSTLVDLSELVSKLYSNLRLKGVNVIDYDSQEKALDRLILTFNIHGFRKEFKLKHIRELADAMLNKFNTIKARKNNSDLINTMYIDFVNEAYKIIIDKTLE